MSEGIKRIVYRSVYPAVNIKILNDNDDGNRSKFRNGDQNVSLIKTAMLQTFPETQSIEGSE